MYVMAIAIALVRDPGKFWQSSPLFCRNLNFLVAFLSGHTYSLFRGHLPILVIPGQEKAQAALQSLTDARINLM